MTPIDRLGSVGTVHASSPTHLGHRLRTILTFALSETSAWDRDSAADVHAFAAETASRKTGNQLIFLIRHRMGGGGLSDKSEDQGSANGTALALAQESPTTTGSPGRVQSLEQTRFPVLGPKQLQIPRCLLVNQDVGSFGGKGQGRYRADALLQSSGPSRFKAPHLRKDL